MSASIDDPYLYEILFNMVFHATKAVIAFLQRDSVLYWPFLISTLVIAFMVWRFRLAQGSCGGRAGWREFSKGHFGRVLWWHPSARLDYRFYVVNAVIFPLLVGPFLFGEITVSHFLNRTIGLMTESVVTGITSQSMAVTVCYTVSFFIAYDFGRFVAHCFLHDVAILWEFHKVHHSAEVLTPLTTFRAHPVDLAIMAWGGALTTGAVTWLFHRFVDNGVSFYTFLGLHIIIWFCNLVGNLRHSQVWLSYGKTLNRWLISPAHHQLHHSAESRHWGCNRGFELAVWDRMYGTLCVPTDKPETLRFGLGDETDGRWRSVGRLYLWPLWLIVKRAVRSQSIQRDPGKR